MAVTLVESARIDDNGTETHTAGAGSNRLCVVTSGAEAVTGAFAPTFGGVGFTDVGSDPFDTSNRQVYGRYILDASIPSGEQTYAQNETDGTGTTSIWGGSMYTFAGVDQADPIGEFAEEAHGNSTSWTTSSVTAPAGSIVVAMAVTASGYNPAADVGGDFVDETKGANRGGWGWYTAYAVVAEAAEVSATFTWSDNEAGVTLLFVVNPAAGGITIEIPAGSVTIASTAPVVLFAQVELPSVAALTIASVASVPLVNYIRGPPVVSATLTGIAPGAVIAHNEQPSAGSLSLTGLQPAVNISSSATVAPGAGALVSQGNNLTLGAVASPGAAELEFTSAASERGFGLQLSGQTATSILGARAATGVDSVALTGQTPLAFLDILGTTIQVPGAALSIIGHAPLVTVPVSISVNTGAMVASTYTPVLEIANAGVAIVNPNAVPVRSNYTHCAYTGFRVPADDLVQTGYGQWVRPKSVEGKHPADFIKAVPQKKKQGPQRPEGPNRFIGEDLPAITADDP